MDTVAHHLTYKLVRSHTRSVILQTMSPVNISFIHSELVDREEVARVCATTLPVRKSKYSYLAEKAVSEFQQRWQEEVAFTYCGGSSPQGPVTAFFPPESKQDRVEVFTKLIEYFFAHDVQLLLIRLLSLLFPTVSIAFSY